MKRPTRHALRSLGGATSVLIALSWAAVLGLTVVDLHRLWTPGPLGWPDATLAMANVLAFPLLGALERMKPEATVELVEALVGRIGIGDVARLIDREPSKYDDHRND